MKKYKIKIYPAAQNDLAEIVDYLATLSEQAALHYYDLITEKIKALATMPERYPLAKDAQLRLRGYRTLPVKSYIVFYTVNANSVELRRILYGRRQYQGLL